MEKLDIFVLEDDKLAQKVMTSQLAGHNVDLAADLKTALKKLETNRYHLGFFDLMLGPSDDYSGLKAIAAAAARGVYAVVVSSSDSDAIIDRAYELGARDFYAKGNEGSNVAELLRKFLQNRRAAGASDIFASAFITGDRATRDMVGEALKYAPTELPLLLLGPSGTGKTSLARVLHEHSGREGAFVAINCSAYTEDLLEAELFGYRKGAFTGAADSRKGRLLEAHNGTLFLDEIGTMSLNMQMKLLKALEERCFYPLGSEKPERSDFRIISATLEDPQDLIARGKMRFDLFQRVHGYTVTLKPLAERREDIFLLVQHFMKGGRRLSFTAEARAQLEAYAWPGNVRELKKFIDLLSSGAEGRVGLDTVKKHLKGQPVRAARADGGADAVYADALARGLESALENVADEVIARNLRENNGVRTKTMADLKISTRLLYASLKRRGLSQEAEK
ncbi:MAG: sigma 54-interacting transcriptional regulator [Elusimicrobiales bacterium]|nr:sigma 54-interacting transcriptional regulator [Elusimicrobiales bacterium]